MKYSQQLVSESDIEAVVGVLKSEMLTQGSAVVDFEEATAAFVGAKFAASFNSGTSALHASCVAIDLAKDDLVWVSAVSFVASANCAKYIGCAVDFVDIDSDNGFNICPNALLSKFSETLKTGRLPKALIVVHMGGAPSDLKPIADICRRYGVKIIEDASHALGAQYHNRRIGCCEYSDITVFSFHPVKMITTGEGGMALTNNPDYSEKLKAVRSHGIQKSEGNLIVTSEGPWYYEQQSLGFNYRMPDILAALGSSQLNSLPQFLETRLQLAERYQQLIDIHQVSTQRLNRGSVSSWHLFILQCEFDDEGIYSRKSLFKFFKDLDIDLNVHYLPIYRHPYYSSNYDRSLFPNAENYYSRAVSIPLHQGLSFKDQDLVIDGLNRFFERGN